MKDMERLISSWIDMADIDILKKVKQKTIILNENMDFSR